MTTKSRYYDLITKRASARLLISEVARRQRSEYTEYRQKLMEYLELQVVVITEEIESIKGSFGGFNHE